MTDSDPRVRFIFSLGLFADDAVYWEIGEGGGGGGLDDIKNDLLKKPL